MKLHITKIKKRTAVLFIAVALLTASIPGAAFAYAKADGTGMPERKQSLLTELGYGSRASVNGDLSEKVAEELEELEASGEMILPEVTDAEAPASDGDIRALPPLDASSGGFQYENVPDVPEAIIITGYTGTNKNVVIPEKLNGKYVVGVSLNSLGLTSLNVTACTALIALSCFGNELTGLDLSGNEFLLLLDCSYNNIFELDIRQTQLNELYCNNNNMSSLLLSKNDIYAYLEVLDCSYNNLEQLTIAQTYNAIVDCSHNYLTSLSGGSFKALDCSYNRFTSLTLGDWNYALEVFNCSHNYLSSLKFGLDGSGPYTRLWWFDVSYNHLSSEHDIAMYCWDFGDSTFDVSGFLIKTHTENCLITYPHTHAFIFDPQLPTKFSDVQPEDWFVSDVKFAVDNKLFAGVSDTEFAPNSAMTRGMVVTVMHSFAGRPAPAKENTFTDVSAGQYYNTPVSWAAENKIVAGMSASEFAPDANITREQFTSILYRYAKDYLHLDVSGSAPLKFADAAQVSSWAVEAVQWCYANGIISGKGGNLFDPQASATRAEIAAMTRRFSILVSK
ncbi:MAG: S-layer homology domain-containing protein [Oscillospiraceae bacterium]|nr:S-layer homology domain-containing protein [Oscillospiraceae bacterium]